MKGIFVLRGNIDNGMVVCGGFACVLKFLCTKRLIEIMNYYCAYFSWVLPIVYFLCT
jgi:hypothetical protein